MKIVIESSKIVHLDTKLMNELIVNVLFCLRRAFVYSFRSLAPSRGAVSANATSHTFFCKRLADNLMGGCCSNAKKPPLVADEQLAKPWTESHLQHIQMMEEAGSTKNWRRLARNTVGKGDMMVHTVNKALVT